VAFIKINGGMPMQKGVFHVSPVLKSVGVISAVAVLVGGVTFAALQSRATLADNTISSASAGLLVDANDDGQFNEEEQGFAFKDIVPGVTPSEAHAFELQNNGETNLKIKAAVKYNGTSESPENQNARHYNDPTAPELPDGVEPSDIVFTFTPEGGAPVSVSWAELSTKKGQKVLDSLAAGETVKMTVQVNIEGDVNASKIDVGSFDIVFTGKAVAAEEPATPEVTEPQAVPAQ
jgi:hypothetical protein